MLIPAIHTYFLLDVRRVDGAGVTLVEQVALCWEASDWAPRTRFARALWRDGGKRVELAGVDITRFVE